MRSSVPLYNKLAAGYDAHFEVPHRRAYDDLSWDYVASAMPRPPARLIDIGSGIGRWALRLTGMGYAIVGIEPAPDMADASIAKLAGRDFELHRCRVEEAEIAPQSCDGAFAMGSLQYSDDIHASIARISRWLRPGAALAVLADSAIALALELIARGDVEDALKALATRRGVWTQHGQSADLHLFDRAILEDAFKAAGFVDVRSRGLLVGASALGRARFTDELVDDYEGRLETERQLAEANDLIDLGKQLLVIGRRPPA
jgi:ubiquinone/menaquinone biosynthesis C-methylase UbiE